MGYSEKSIAGIFHNRAEKYQYEPCVRYKKEGRYTDISWKEMQRMVTNLGLGLISLGVEKDDIVTIFSENCWQWLVADLASLSIGAADAPIYATNSGEEAAYIINDSGSRFLFVSDQDHLNRVLGVKSTLKGLKKIITFDPISAGDKDIISLDEVIKLGEEYKDKKSFDERLLSIEPEALATLIYTSGTTGPPKGVMLTHANLTANILQCYASHPIIGHQDVALTLLPWSHSLGRTVSVYLMLHIGAILSLAESFGTVMENMTEIRPTLMVSVPRLFEKIHAGIFSKVEKASPTKKKLFFWAVDVAMRAVDYRVQRKSMPWSLKIQYDLAESLIYSKLRHALGMDRIRIFINGGGALAVDRVAFAQSVQEALAAESLVEIRRAEVPDLPPADWEQVIVATG
ncbi:MAG TPA: AMP-binding protein, partial [Deltaproteobacteria bacterium]|nr:AMP-binding protein [Deltaproteobacteria bacterium]